MKAKDTAQAAALVGVVGLGGVAAWYLVRGVKDLAGGLSDGLGAFGEGLASLGKVGADAGRAVEGAVQPTVNFFDPPKSSDYATYAPGQRTLKLIVEKSTGKNSKGVFGRKTNTVDVRVVDAVTNAPVHGALVRALLVDSSVDWTQGKARDEELTGPDGRTTLHWWVRDLPGTSSEDDADLIATKQDYNSSQKVRIA